MPVKMTAWEAGQLVEAREKLAIQRDPSICDNLCEHCLQHEVWDDRSEKFCHLDKTEKIVTFTVFKAGGYAGREYMKMPVPEGCPHR